MGIVDSQLDLHSLEAKFGDRVRVRIPLARYTAARLGGPADALLEVNSKNELAEAARWLWQAQVPFFILGGGSNVLISDAGVRGVVILNHSRLVRFDAKAQPPQVWAESGANFGAIARQAAQRGLSGLEWASGIPGTLGGAVVGNAGAFGSDLSHSLIMAEILHRNGIVEDWPVVALEYTYRSSVLKSKDRDFQQPGQYPGGGEYSPNSVVLAALLQLERSVPETVQERMESFGAYRRRTQPPGASMGSMFKNPPSDYAGRLIEAAGLKGARRGQAEISSLHANFFINLGQASATDVRELLDLAQSVVSEKFGVHLELEIQLLGEW